MTLRKQKCKGCFGKGEGWNVKTSTWEVCAECKGTGWKEVEVKDDWQKKD